jgi:hypothetical protein
VEEKSVLGRRVTKPFKSNHRNNINLFFRKKILFIFFVFLVSPPVESDSGVTSGIKWFQPPPIAVAGSNRGSQFSANNH